MIYDYVVTKPPLDEMYEDVIQHFNPFHDKRNGQFTFKNGVSSARTDKLRRKAERATAKAAKANKKAAQAGNSLLHPFKAKRKSKLQTKAFKAQYKANKLNAKLSKSENKDEKQFEKESKYQEKINEIANSNQDMFNDLLFESYYGKDQDKADQEARTLLREIAKENNIKVEDLGKKVLSEFEKREQSIARNKESQSLSNIKDKRIETAKKEDKYDLNFLEAVQNKEWYDDKNKMLSEYSKYLDDPKKYWLNR